jgi:uncharacterized protein (DUF1778 family)
MPSATSTARLEARISTELHAMLKRAGEIQGRSLTDFVVSAAQEAAQRAIEQGEVVRLSLALERAFARRRKLLRSTLKDQVRTCPSGPSLTWRHIFPDADLQAQKSQDVGRHKK